MERRNILNKFKDMKEKGKKAFMARVTSNDLESPTDDQQHKPDKNMFFMNDELKGLFDTIVMNYHSNEELIAEGEKGKEYTDPIPFQSCIINTLDGNAKYWIGKDYVNFIIKDLVNLEAPYVDIVDRTQTPRMPWHDIGAVVGELEICSPQRI